MTALARSASRAARRARDLTKRTEYLSFRVGREQYALRIDPIGEILRVVGITPVPRTAKHVAGVASIRGTLAAIVDLRVLFGHPVTSDAKNRILLVDRFQEKIGLLVDEVQEVLRLDDSDIEPPNALGAEPPPYVLGVTRPDGGDPIVLLEIHLLLANR
ncbi:MAG: purine-binding chemotaxis protein CheW [Polyangiaceae bacterium]|nr:purine-binding chemotaxis protein CheW [Polyangiaceae bacterium]